MASKVLGGGQKIVILGWEIIIISRLLCGGGRAGCLSPLDVWHGCLVCDKKQMDPTGSDDVKTRFTNKKKGGDNQILLNNNWV